jgi:hypothetical protein
MKVVKIKCPYCKSVFDYSEEEIEWVPILKMVLTENLKEQTGDKYLVTCKNKNCRQKIEFWM